MLGAADPWSAITPILVAVVMVAGSVLVALITRADRQRLNRLEDDVADCKKRDRRKKKALLHLGVDLDDPVFDDDEE